MAAGHLAASHPLTPFPLQEEIEHSTRISLQGWIEKPIAPKDWTIIGSIKVPFNHCPTPEDNDSRSSVMGLTLSNFASPSPRHPSFYQDKPMVVFHKADKAKLLAGMKNVLVAKFSHGQPSIGMMKTFLSNRKLIGKFHVSFFDAKHIFIEFEIFQDFAKFWIKQKGIIQGFPVRFFKWDEKFHPSKESSIFPVWIHLPLLPLYLFEEGAILLIASALGRPLHVDINNINRNKIGYATVCIEFDILRAPPADIWIQFGECNPAGKTTGLYEGFLQKVVYGFMPSFCSYCNHIGHQHLNCKRVISVKDIKHTIHLEHQVEDCQRTIQTLAAKRTASSHSGDESVQDQLQLGVLEEGEILDLEAGAEPATGDVTAADAGMVTAAVFAGADLLTTMNSFAVETLEEGEIAEDHVGAAPTKSVVNVPDSDSDGDALSEETSVSAKNEDVQGVLDEGSADVNQVAEQDILVTQDGYAGDEENIKITPSCAAVLVKEGITSGVGMQEKGMNQCKQMLDTSELKRDMANCCSLQQPIDLDYTAETGPLPDLKVTCYRPEDCGAETAVVCSISAGENTAARVCSYAVGELSTGQVFKGVQAGIQELADGKVAGVTSWKAAAVRTGAAGNAIAGLDVDKTELQEHSFAGNAMVAAGGGEMQPLRLDTMVQGKALLQGSRLHKIVLCISLRKALCLSRSKLLKARNN